MEVISKSATGRTQMVCLTLDDARIIMEYLVETETELRKCAITVHEVNEERQK